jgi:hypothetical protein
MFNLLSGTLYVSALILLVLYLIFSKENTNNNLSSEQIEPV